MKENSVLRREAATSLDGKWTTSALFVLVFFIILVVVNCLLSALELISDSMDALGSLLSAFFAVVLEYGAIVAFLHQFRGREIQISNLFDGFKSGPFSTMILMTVYTYLWALLLVIPGIIKSYSYALTPYLVNDEGLQNNAAIEKSMAMMQGKKMKLFLLDLSFIGWYILGLIPLGLGTLWVYPYHNSARAAFYEDVKAEA